MSKKKSKTTSTETVGPSAYSQPYIDQAASTFRPAYEQSQGMLSEFMPRVRQSADYYGNVLSGDYLGGNPHLQGVIDSSNRDISDNVNSQFMDRFGSGYHTKTLANSLAENENRLRYGDYATERGYQNEAAARLPGVATTATALPMLPAQGYADMTGNLLGRYMTSNGTQRTTQSGGVLGTIGQALQVAAQVAPFVPSDVRLKTDIARVGVTDAGLPLYSFRYKGGDTFHIGPMAQDVERTQPGAMGPDIHGFKTVHYGKVR